MTDPEKTNTQTSESQANPQELDVTGLNCPMPLLKAKKALNSLAAGARLLVRATDPGSVRDFEVFAQQSGHALLESRTEDGVFVYLLQKKGSTLQPGTGAG